MEQQRAAAAMSKRSKKTVKSNFAYWAWGGGMTAVLLALVVLLLWEPQKEVETRTSKEIPINDEITIDKINNAQSAWQAAASPAFEGYTLKTVKVFGQLTIDKDDKIRGCPIGKTALLRSFDARSKWPECFANRPIMNQGNCSSSSAIVAASSYANRLCIADPGNHRELTMSAQQILASDDAVTCKSSSVTAPFKFLKEKGLVSEKCMPYKGSSEEVTSEAKCTDEPVKAVDICRVNSMGNVMAEITLNGPVMGLVALTKDFFLYKQGVYTVTKESRPLYGKARRRLYAAVKILGWGYTDDEDRIPYWLVENSWGTEWGENGFARIHRSNNDDSLIVEGHVYTGVTSEIPLPPKKKDELEEMDDDDDDDVEAEKKDKDDDDLDEEEVTV